VTLPAVPSGHEAGIPASDAPAPASAAGADDTLDVRVARAAFRLIRRTFRRLIAFQPTRRLAMTVALSSPVWLVSGRAAFVVLVLLASVIVLDALSTPAPWQLTVERQLPASVGLGDEAAGSYVVRSRARRALRLALFDALPRGIAGDAARLAPWRVPPGGELRVPVTITGRERGAWPLGPIVVRVAGRFGLVRRSMRHEPGDAIRVTPSVSGIRRFRLLALHHRLRDLGLRAIRRRGEGTNFAGLREYVVGDEPRRIDWKATARRDRLMVREYTVEQGQTVLIAVDAGRMMTQLEGPVPRFEYALSSALMLADVAAQSRDQVGLLVFDDQVRAYVPPARGAEALERIRSALVPARATMAEPDYASAFRTLATRHRKRSLIVLFTDVVDPLASQSLIALTSRSAARHLLVLVALRNDQLVRAAMPAGDASSTRLYEAAAAEELVLAREEALARMRRAGVSVLDVSPRAMTAAVINRYLEIKARASL